MNHSRNFVHTRRQRHCRSQNHHSRRPLQAHRSPLHANRCHQIVSEPSLRHVSNGLESRWNLADRRRGLWYDVYVPPGQKCHRWPAAAIVKKLVNSRTKFFFSLAENMRTSPPLKRIYLGENALIIGKFQKRWKKNFVPKKENMRFGREYRSVLFQECRGELHSMSSLPEYSYSTQGLRKTVTAREFTSALSK